MTSLLYFNFVIFFMPFYVFNCLRWLTLFLYFLFQFILFLFALYSKLWFISGHSDGYLLIFKSLSSILFHFNCLCLVVCNCSKLVYGYTLTSSDFNSRMFLLPFHLFLFFICVIIILLYHIHT